MGTKLPQKYTGFKNPDYSLNEMQELLVPYMEDSCNVFIKAKTSSGKTTALYLYGCDVIEKEGKSIIYVASFKALAEEKRRDLEDVNHPWHEVPRVTITGDHQFDKPETMQKLRDALFITITPESLISLLRNKSSERSSILKDVGMIYLDEIHLTSEDGRGPNYEIAVQEFTKDYPDVRIIAASGTVKNHEEFLTWLTKCNGRRTALIESDYRPIVVTNHFKPYPDFGTQVSEKWRIRNMLSIINDPDKANQKFLIVFFKKAFQYEALKALKDNGKHAMCHNADIADLDERVAIENQFVKGGLQFLLCTQTLIVGMNMPARNVIVMSEKAGGSDVPAMTLQQAGGRAGRPGYDTAGDAYFYVSESEQKYHEKRIIEGENIYSKLLDKRALATHFVGALYMRRFNNEEGFFEWYERTLACQQQDLENVNIKEFLKKLVDDLKKRQIIKLVNGVYILGPLGTICAQMMICPYDGFAIYANFSAYFDVEVPNEADICKAVSEIPSYTQDYIPKDVEFKIPAHIRATVYRGNQVLAAAVDARLRGENIPDYSRAAFGNFRKDIDRLSMFAQRVSGELGMWKDHGNSFSKEQRPAKEKIELIFARVKHGLSTWDSAKLKLRGARNSEIKKFVKADGINIPTDNLDMALEFLKNA